MRLGEALGIPVEQRAAFMAWVLGTLPAFAACAGLFFGLLWRLNNKSLHAVICGLFAAMVATAYVSEWRAAPITLREARVNSAKQSAKFSFISSGGGRGFQCALIKKKKGEKPPKPSFSACKSPKTYKNLKPGEYTFEVHVLSPGGAGPAAKKRFGI